MREALHRSTAGNVMSSVPIRVYQGGQDALVGTATTAAYVFRACAVGDQVSARVYPAADHGTVLEAATPDLLPWIDDRVAGNPVAGAC